LRPGPHLDVLVLGSGVAGLSAAIRAATLSGLSVGVLTKAGLSQATTRWAQGGVAAVLGSDEDSTDLHLADTLRAGAGLCDADAVRTMVDEGPGRVNELIALGAVFDRSAGGSLDLQREGGHSTARVLHARGAATGAEVERALVEAVRQSAAAVWEGWFAIDLLIENGRCAGVRALAPGGETRQLRADHVLAATGGAGQLFAATTNPPEATGDGIAMAARAGAALADMEFVQFHPTALHHPAMPRPLLSEALRGHGALLRDHRGERFVDELSPRDVVSRAMAARMAEQGVEHLWLDATGLAAFATRFPTIAASLEAAGLDPASDWLPIAPAAHHLSGGILTDLDGATTVPGLWAAGEAACTGAHGANRLASNSLLEGMVFAPRVIEAISRGVDGPSPTGAMRALLRAPGGVGARLLGKIETASPQHPRPLTTTDDLHKLRDRLQRAMTGGAGVLRSAESLENAAAVVNELAGRTWPTDRAALELANLMTLAQLLLASASARVESRGAHTRTDFPSTDPDWRVRLVHR
jgi:L-aspartate oxidase